MRKPSWKIGYCALLVSQLVLASCRLGNRNFQVIARAPAYMLRSPDLRQTPFNQILQNYNGFEPAHSWIDLRPLMQLRIENAYYQKGASRRGLQGFLGTEIARYEVRPSGLGLVSVQPMEQRPPADPPAQDLISHAIGRARLYRLYYEIVFNKVKNSHGSVLIAANSQEELEQLSARLDHPETVCGEGSVHCAVFPEACTVSVEMKVVVNGTGESVLWGSLLAGIVGDHPQHVDLKRLYAGKLIRVEIDVHDTSALKLPLVPGDHIAWD